jgi:Cu-Zn family superoxide dismutase
MTMRRSLAHAGVGYLAMLGLLACAHAGDQPATNPAGAPAAAPATKVAVADMAPTQGSSVKGHVTFEAKHHGVRVVADFTGLTPGEHGFHIHEKGDCSAPDGTSAGAHFNPTGKPHGEPGTAEHHAGDLGNIQADKAGVAHLDVTFPHLTLDGAESIVGRGLIVHASPDDMKTQPTGNSGARQACGVIKAQ